jgi:hypothetical protein
VEKLWSGRAKPVEKLTTKKYLWPDRGVDLTCGGMWTPSSRCASLDHSLEPRRIVRSTCITQNTRDVTVHCFEEFIGERAFVVEVTDAGNRWRAQLRRRPGVPTAMMPFYGASPAEAAHRLLDWMRRAHERQLAGAAAPRQE